MKNLSTDMAVLLGLGIALLAFVGFETASSVSATNLAKHQRLYEEQQHDALHEENVRRRHELALAYNRAHPEEVARRRAIAVAAAAEKRRQAEMAAIQRKVAEQKARKEAAAAQAIADAQAARQARENHPCGS